MARPRKNPTPSDSNHVAGKEPPPHAESEGDLSPAFIQWFKRNHSEEEYLKRYTGRIPRSYASEIGIDPI